ncbi:sigma-70 family RNA polymerase sigma factor [Roseivirga sp. BDSF3-8]|uniref:sigma-70 family RNA polymerase sigma factor n=1 Tax=Roseivirga sp. BDSF3-8 TaxID=3241598 RepID=UPI003531C167
MSSSALHTEVDRLYRTHYGSLTASLSAFFRLANLELAEDVVQNAFMAALRAWEKDGLPREPVAWLYRTCRNMAINELRRKQPLSAPAGRVSALPIPADDARLRQTFLQNEINDNRLRLLFATCHPDFAPRARLILTLKTLGGLKRKRLARR